MKLSLPLYLLLTINVLMSSCRHMDLPRQKSFDENWEFHRGDTKDSFNDSSDPDQWRKIDLPHDWSIEGMHPGEDGIDAGIFSTESDGGAATGHTLGGVSWYRKKFKVPDTDKLYSLYFEGVYQEAEIWINGKKVLFHPYGYTSFLCDITAYCKLSGQENTVAVRVSNLGENSRWYSGSGIYRHVWLISTGKMCLKTWGVFIRTLEIMENQAILNVSAEICNRTHTDGKPVLNIRILDPSGKIVARQKQHASLSSGEEEVISQDVKVPDPLLWSVDSPNMYTAIVSVSMGNEVLDEIAETFGIRTLSFSAERGFVLNDQTIKLKGGCIHHDNGLLGAAAIDRAEERKVELLKASGFNAVRCAHNPPSVKFLETCDRMGLLVIDEAFDQWTRQKKHDDYHRFFDQYHQRDVASMVFRDRNHPSVILWSIGNEIPERADSAGVTIAGDLKHIILQYDRTRPVTAAVCTFWDNPGLKWSDSERAFQTLDVCGYNYVWWEYEKDHHLFPERIIYGSESVAQDRSRNWSLVNKYPWVIGDFVWTAMDYLGESGLAHAIKLKNGEDDTVDLRPWPWFNAWCGDIDICGDQKPQSLYRDIIWDRSRISMAVRGPINEDFQEKVSYWGWPEEWPDWNRRKQEGQQMQIRVFTKYPVVRLFLNGALLEEKHTRNENPWKYTAMFNVDYFPGKLKAVGVENGIVRDSVLLETTGPVSKIRLTADRSVIRFSRNDLSYVKIELVDDEGNLVVDEDRKVELSLSGNGEIAGSGNASPWDMDCFRSLTPKTFRGRALVILRPTATKGSATLQVKLSGEPGIVKPASVMIEVE